MNNDKGKRAMKAAEASMVRLDAPKTIDDEMRLLVRILRHVIGPEKLVLGGGALLEAMWHHRRSTDIDFFITRGDTLNVIRDMANRKEALGNAVTRIRLAGECYTEGPEAKGALMRGTIRGVPFTIYPSDILHERRNRRARITGIPSRWATVEEVFKGKIGERWMKDLTETEEGERWAPPVRDLYDVAVARTRAPDKLQRVVSELGARERERISGALEAVTSADLDGDPKNLLSAKYHVDLLGTARQMGIAIQERNVQEIRPARLFQKTKQAQGTGR